jgi:hypothetical protein
LLDGGAEGGRLEHDVSGDRDVSILATTTGLFRVKAAARRLLAGNVYA